MINLFKRFIDFILPQRCLLCGKVIHSDNSLCSDCFDNINFITKPYCLHCGKPLFNIKNHSDVLLCAECLSYKDYFRMKRAAILYDDISKKLILDFKFANHIENKILFSRWLMMAGKDILQEGADVIIPIPLHYTRLLHRKYNQSAMLAKEFSLMAHIPACFNVLKKVKITRTQSQCSSKERQKNVKNAFKVVNPHLIKGKRVILIDDVYTTGATMNECAKILLKAGAQSVDALTVAMVYDK